jgi:Flp pilus assembly protein TadB
VLAAPVPLMAQFLSPDDGPGQSGDFQVSPRFFLVLLGLGFLIGTVGHIVKSRTLVAAGVLLIFAATVFLPIAYTVSR